MKKFIGIFFILVLVGMTFAGTPHSIYGTLQNSFGGSPSDGNVTFEAFVTTRPGEVLTQSSTGCGYGSGSWYVSVGNFTTSWAADDVVQVNFVDTSTGETGSDQVILTNDAADNGGLTVLSAPANETISTPPTPTSSDGTTVFRGKSVTYQTTGASSNLGHPVEYRFEWESGVYSDWGSNGQSHTYTSNGSKQIRVQARCQWHTGTTSSWSSYLNITVTGCNLSTNVSPGGSGTVTPNPTQPGDGYAYGTSVQLTAAGIGNYAFTTWSGDDISGSSTNPETITMNGNKSVTANFAEETTSTPTTLTGPSSGFKGQSLSFTTGGSTNNYGHSVEYQFDWGDGNFSSWGSTSQSHSYSNASVFTVKSRARCVDHTSVVSGWSTGKAVTISSCVLTVNENPDAGGDVTKDPNRTEFSYNESVTLTADPATGYEFTGWSGDASGTSLEVTIQMTGNKTVNAGFGQVVNITFQTNPVGRTFIVGGQTYSSTQVLSFNPGENVSISVPSPQIVSGTGDKERYLYASWSDGGNQTHTYTVPSSNATVTANFTHQYYLDITDTQSSSSGEDWYNAGTTAVITATSPANESNGTRYLFASWSGDVSTSSNPANVLMDGIKNITANWIAQHQLNITKTPSAGGNVNVDPLQTWYNAGSWVNLTATANQDYEFTGWGGDASGTTNPLAVQMNSKKDIIANFGTETVSTPNTPSGPASGNPGDNLSYSTGGSTSSFGNPVQYRFDWGDGNTSSWGNATQSHTFNNSGTYSVKAQAQSSSGVTSSWSAGKSVSIASFAITLTADPVEGGTISKSPDKEVYNYNEVVTLTANPTDASWAFKQWSGDLSGTTNPETITMSSAKSVTAEFQRDTVSPPVKPTSSNNSAFVGQTVIFTTDDTTGGTTSFGNPIEYRFEWGDGTFSPWSSSKSASHVYSAPSDQWYRVKAFARSKNSPDIVSEESWYRNIQITWINLTTSVSPSGAGTVEKSPDKEGYSYGDNVTLTANANEGNLFESWSGDITDGSINGNQITVYLTQNRSIQANFKDGNETVSTPNTPTGPTSALMGQSVAFETGGSTSSKGSAVEYQFDWGDGNTSDYGSTIQNYTYQTAGAFQVKARARSQVEPSAVSGWSDVANITVTGYTLTVGVNPASKGNVLVVPEKTQYAINDTVTLTATAISGYGFSQWSGDLTGNQNPTKVIMTGSKNITANFAEMDETVTTPIKPTGPVAGSMGQELLFVTGGSTTASGSAAQYQYDWGDGTQSQWGVGTQYHTYFTIGQMVIKARARSAGDTTVVSSWSDPHTCTISGIIPPISVFGPDSGFVGQELAFYTNGPNNLQVGNENYDIDYQFSWGDGNTSAWGDSARMNVFNAPANREIKVRARLASNTAIVTDWSAAKTCRIVGIQLIAGVQPVGAGTVSKAPDKAFYVYGDQVVITATAAGSDPFTGWTGDVDATTNPLELTLTDHMSVTAHFSQSGETVSKPIITDGPASVYRKQPARFFATGAVSSKGNPVEYQYDWGDGLQSDWGDSTAVTKFTVDGSYFVKVRARSKTNVTALSEWSTVSPVTVMGCVVTLQVQQINSNDPGTVSKTPEKADYDYGDQLTLEAVPLEGYLFNMWDDGISDSSRTIYVLSDTTITAVFEGTAVEEKVIPTLYALEQNYPNPFNPQTTIQYSLPEAAYVKVSIFDVKGQRVNQLVDGLQEAGNYSIIWNARDQYGNKVTSGMYFYQMETEQFTQIHKMILLK